MKKKKSEEDKTQKNITQDENTINNNSSNIQENLLEKVEILTNIKKINYISNTKRFPRR